MKIHFPAALLPLFAAGSLAASTLTVYPSGRAELSAPNEKGKAIVFQPMANWHNMAAHGELPARDDAPFPVQIWCNRNQTLKGSFAAKQDGQKATLCYQLKAESDFKVGTAFLNVWLPSDEFAGTKYWINTWEKELPLEKKAWFVFQEKTAKLTFLSTDGLRKITLSFPKKMHFHIQDERPGNNPNFSVRIGSPWGRGFKKGEAFDITVTIEEECVPVRVAVQRPLKIKADKEWMAFVPKLDIEPGSALDFTQMPWHHEPAGKYGYVVAKGDQYEFETKPGRPVRFYGANLCYSANFVDKDAAEKTARRLAATGYNAVRIHHHDQHGWGYFGMVKGMKDGTTLNATELAKFDLLIAALVKNGLYITTDLFVSRETVPWREIGVDREGVIHMDDFKIWCVVHEGAWENLKKFTRALYTHVNPHTGRCLAKEPALAFISIINEGNFNNYSGRVRNCPAWQQGWKRWLAKKRKSDSAYNSIKDEIPPRFDADTPDAIAFRIYMKEVDDAFVRKAKRFLREELGCKALVTNSNGWSQSFAEHQETRELVYDYVDEHFYVDHPSNIGGYPSNIANNNLFRERDRGVTERIFSRVMDKPFAITEFNYTAPGRNRCAGGLLLGTLAAFQNWNGMWRFAWTHEGSAMGVDESPVMKNFNVVTDPINQMAERALSALFLRGDMPKATRTLEILVPQATLDDPKPRPVYPPNWANLGWRAKIGTVLRHNPKADFSVRFEEAYAKGSTPPADMKSLPLGDGRVTINPENGSFAVATPRTCGIFSEGQTPLKADALLAMTATRAALWATSIDGQPLRTSSRILLMHLTDVQNSGTIYQDPITRRMILSGGKLPHLVLRGEAKVRLAVSNAKAFDVWALDFTGRRLGKLHVKISPNGELDLNLKTEQTSGQVTFAYELVRK